MKKAVYAGSFDPLTLGHIDIIKRACNLFDEVCILINTNPAKKSLLSIEDKRLSIKYDVIEEYNLSNITLHECSNDYTVDYCNKIGAKFLIRGIRNAKDFEYEDTLANFNKHLNDEIETIILFANNDLASVSSSGIKSLVGFNTWEQRIKPFLPFYAYNIMLERNNAGRELFVNAVSLLSNWEVGDPDFYNPSERYYELLKNRYSVNNNRHYHSMNHLMRGLSVLNDSALINSSPKFLNEEERALLTVAYFYHDYQYNTNYLDEDNIRDSIRMMEAHHKKDFDNINKKYFKILKRLIQVTDHKSEAFTHLERIIVEIDLISLGDEWKDYEQMTKHIRREFGQYSDTVWLKGRAEFVSTMLSKGISFEHLLDIELTYKVGQNLEYELKLLQSI